ncbi:uncharacterized protein LOC130902199 [Diorhabda carinulata]|uniref:uncharacterized protein LOC130902199 n=1 Tax=Diorhabda carinulata TaxID=1163345 RepID=UPI0025A21A7F|nr:uncharacterized protein LOC130902199 [Diorhabda carinulata]
MKSTLLFFCFLCAIFTVHGWTAIIRRDPATAHLGDCYTTIYNLGAFKCEEIKRIRTECATATCRKNGDIYLAGCGVQTVEPPYKMVPGDLSKPFPECCYRMIGPINDTTTNEQTEN